MQNWPFKDPLEILDYQILWDDRLPDADNIANSSWQIVTTDTSNTISITSNTHSNTTTTIWISGGTLNQNYVFRNTIVTTGGRTFEESVRLKIDKR